MEDVYIKKNKRIKGFINQNGVFIKVTNAVFEDLKKEEVLAESICISFEKCLKSVFQMKEELKEKGITSLENIFTAYLVEHYGYLYIEFSLEDGNFDIVDIIHPQDIKRINRLQKNRLFNLCNRLEKKLEDYPKLLFLK